MARQFKLYDPLEVREVAEVLDDSNLQAINESILKYNNPKSREVLSKFGKFNGELTGSSPFMLVHLINSGFLPKGARLATRPDLEKAFAKDNKFLIGNYTDFGLALRSAGDSYKKENDLPAKILAEQLSQKGINLDSGKLIYLNDLTLKEHDNSAYGLVFELKEETQKENIRNLSEFNWHSIRNEGLSCAYFYRNWDWIWYSADVRLGRSNGDGRVVLVSAEGALPKISEHEVIKPDAKEIIKYSRRYVPEAVREEYEKGLTERLSK